MPNPLILAPLFLPVVSELTDLGIDTTSLVLQLNQFVYSEVNTGMIMTLDVVLAVASAIENSIEDFQDDSEIKKLQQALYNPKLLNKLLGDALNFGCSEPVVKWSESSIDWQVPSWFQSIENMFFELTGLPQDCYDFAKNTGFNPDVNTYPDLTIWCSQELKYLNARWY